jgi:hypothetical protein
LNCQVLTNVISLDARSNAFLALRPEWTLAGATLSCGTSGDVSFEQTPFRWIDGIWEAVVAIQRTGRPEAVPHQLTLRITSDTLRRWKDIGINPFLEACAQIREHICGTQGSGTASFLTLL